MDSLGTHCILELYDCPPGLLNDLSHVQQAIRDASRSARSTLLGETAHRFEPQGVTALALLAESHISVHTWPELGYAAADVFTCGLHTTPQRACEHLVRALQARHYRLRKITRGDRLLSPVRGHRRPTAVSPPAAAEPAADADEAFRWRARSWAQTSG